MSTVMDKNRGTAKNDASTKTYVLCEMPADWTSLPVRADPESPPSPNQIAVYRKRGRGQKRTLVYEGYIRPPAQTSTPMSKLHLPPRLGSFRMKHQRLLEKIKAESEAETKIALEQQMNKDSSTNIIAEEEPSIMPGPDESKLQKKVEAIATSETDTDCPLPLVALGRRERLLSAPSESGTEENLECFEPLEDTRVDTVKYTGGYSGNTNYPLPLQILERQESLLPVPPEQGLEFLDDFELDYTDTPEDSFLKFLETI
ncbi:hypothetical protein GBF38_019651 [Nibea albiflora]|uniref:Uncharacterized protein n=1 Tax=Nibea albiflora TaxID=240163 RepID=A0ACB7F373_NIBAL|nr:hypothetical protein GBF38_019651 [Nibea albiflora]